MIWFPYFPKFFKTLPSQEGKVFVITGTTSGTGLVAARTVAQKGGEAVLLNRASGRVEKMLEMLRNEVPEGKFVPVECDLQDFDSVRKAAQEIKSRYPKIYCLANNAGIMATPDRATVNGYDTQMQTNHLSHFLLTKELYPLLEAEAEATGDARIVNHSSGARDMTPNNGLEEKYFGPNGGNLGGDELGLLSGPCYNRYFQSKLANSVFTYGLYNKLEAKNSKVRAVCAHPGGSDTHLADHLVGGMTGMLLKVLAPFVMQTAEDGAMGLLTGMMLPDAKSGVLYGPKYLSGKAIPNPPKKYENDPKAIDMLWRTSEAATGVSFEP